jgi:hypothetical protein
LFSATGFLISSSCSSSPHHNLSSWHHLASAVVVLLYSLAVHRFVPKMFSLLPLHARTGASLLHIVSIFS